jgi:DNA topoisomerase-3
MTFILAEKPSVAESFAAALNIKKDNGYYRNGDYTITNCIGHLLTLYDAQDYDGKFQKWNIPDLPIVPDVFKHKPIDRSAKQLELVKSLLEKKYDKYIIATDAGREGELIARLVLAHCQVTDFSRVYRFWTSSALTKDVILENLKKVKSASGYDGLYSAGLYRQLSDWLIGINFSRYFTCKLNNKFIFGRVQTPVLNMLVRREADIKKFIKSFFYRLEVPSSFGGADFVSYLLNGGEDGEINFDSKEAFQAFLQGPRESSRVASVLVEEKTEFPPRLFDLTELQKKANAKFGYTSRETLDIAQALYEKHKCLSYPRTASRYLSRVNYDLFIKCLDSIGVTHNGIDITNTNIFNDEAMERNKEDHHALMLLNKLPGGASDAEKNIYRLVFENMAAIIKNPYVYEKTTVKHTENNFWLVARGKKVLDPGWKENAGADEGEGEDEDEAGQALPEFKEGDEITLKDPRITEHERKPPKSFTEAALLAAMKKYGLGTVATRDTIIESLIYNEYCFRKGKNLLPSEKACFFISSIIGLGNDNLTKYLDVDNTQHWEDMLENHTEQFFQDIKEFLSATINSLRDNSLQIFQNKIAECPLCKNAIVAGKTNYYCSGYKEGCKFSVGKVIRSAAITEADIKALLAGKKTGLKSMKSKEGKDFKAYLQFDKEFNIKFEFKNDDAKAKGKA